MLTVKSLGLDGGQTSKGGFVSTTDTVLVLLVLFLATLAFRYRQYAIFALFSLKSAVSFVTAFQRAHRVVCPIFGTSKPLIVALSYTVLSSKVVESTSGPHFGHYLLQRRLPSSEQPMLAASRCRPYLPTITAYNAACHVEFLRCLSSKKGGGTPQAPVKNEFVS